MNMNDINQNTNKIQWLPFIPFTILPGALIWALFWLLFDLSFQILGTKEIWLPQIALVIVLIVVAYPISKPIAKLSLKALPEKQTFGKGIAIIVTLLAIALGETSYLIASVWLHKANIPLISIILAIPKLVGNYEGDYIFLKCLFAVGIVMFTKEDIEKHIKKCEASVSRIQSGE